MVAGSFLGPLTHEDRAALAEAGRRRRLPPRTRVFEAGDEAHEVLIVANGAVKLTRVSADGREVVVAVRDEGAILGELAAIDGGVRSTSATTLVPVELIAVPFDDFRALLDTRASIARALLDVLAERLRESTDRVLELGTADALTRVCRRLVEFADGKPGAEKPGAEKPGAEKGGAVLRVPLTQQEMASICGLSREAVVKALKTLRNLGWIDVAGREVTLYDLDALRERAIG
jgi:CRP/FNR family transcriptional regulator, cyclic AMP receptor protein